MKYMSIFLMIFGIIVITYPEFLAYLIGGFFVFIGFNMFVAPLVLKKKSEDFVKFGDYKIFRGK